MHRNAIRLTKGRNDLKEEVIDNGKIWIKFSGKFTSFIALASGFFHKFEYYIIFFWNILQPMGTFTLNRIKYFDLGDETR